MQRVFTQLQQAPHLQLNQTLRKTVGIDFHIATGRLAQAWQFPDTLIVAMSKQGNIA